MPRLFPSLGLVVSLSLAASLVAPSPANACGGGSFYTEVSSSETVSTTGHRVVISLSKAQTVLWDQIKFAGNPKDFAWIYPVKSGAKLEIASDTWTEALDFKTTKFIQSPTVECYDDSYSGEDSGGGCNTSCAPGAGLKDGAGNGGDFRNVGGDQDEPVDIIHAETIGPYDTVTITSDVPGAIGKWLTDNGYQIPADVQPILDDYAADGFDFIALRLTPGKGVDQMKPVRVVTPGAGTTFPMRMLSAGALDKVALNVMILSEGRVEVSGFANAEISRDDIVWDFDSDSSNYAALRDEALAKDGGAVFLTSYALNGSLFGKRNVAVGAETIAAEYYESVERYGAGKGCDYKLLEKLNDVPESNDPSRGFLVVDVCDDMGACGEAGANEIDSRDLECGEAKDLAVAVTGMHPKDIWVTRLEANLPKAALDKDLVLTATPSVVEIPAYEDAETSKGDACANAGAPVLESAPRPKPPLPPSALGLIGAAVALALATARRRFTVRGRAAA